MKQFAEPSHEKAPPEILKVTEVLSVSALRRVCLADGAGWLGAAPPAKRWLAYGDETTAARSRIAATTPIDTMIALVDI
jgi:hypothetical protein